MTLGGDRTSGDKRMPIDFIAFIRKRGDKSCTRALRMRTKGRHIVALSLRDWRVTRRRGRRSEG